MSTFVQQEINNRNRWVYFSKYRWLAHIAYWSWVLIVGTLMRVKVPVTPSVIYNHFILSNIHIAVFFYLYCMVLIPYFFKRNKAFLFWVLVALSMFLIPVSDTIFNKHFVHLSGTDPSVERTFLEGYLNAINGYVSNFLLFTILLFFMERNERNSLEIELEQEKKEIEIVKLNLLKTNISPDFMMRSLGQLKRAALVPEPYTPEAIIKFSELLRYRLYRGKQLKSPLQEELQALQDFIQFIGYEATSNYLDVELKVTGNTDSKFIAALALINLLEPFCKIIPEQPAILKLNIYVQAELLKLNIVYSQHATPLLFADLEKYGDDYIQLYGSAVNFNFENCEEDTTCKIEMILPLVA